MNGRLVCDWMNEWMNEWINGSMDGEFGSQKGMDEYEKIRGDEEVNGRMNQIN